MRMTMSPNEMIEESKTKLNELNFKFGLNEDGTLRMDLKDSIVGMMDANTYSIFDTLVLPILGLNKKFVLTGSLSLKLLGFEKFKEDEKIGDIDLGLLDKFTEEDYDTLRNFFNLYEVNNDRGQYMTDTVGQVSVEKIKKFDPNQRLWQVSKDIETPFKDLPPAQQELYRPLWSNLDENDHIVHSYAKIDIFNDEIIRPRDIITVSYKGFEIRLVHPSVTYSYRMRYALDVRGNNGFKYWERMNNLMKHENAKEYYKTLRALQYMIMRTKEHNCHIEGDKGKIARLRGIILDREMSADNFINRLDEQYKNNLTHG